MLHDTPTPPHNPTPIPALPNHCIASVESESKLTVHNPTGGAPKRRKHGAAGSISGSTTSSAHPLRQTSFPPEESAIGEDDTALRSPSVESDFTGIHSAVTGGTGPGPGTSTAGGKKRSKGKGKRAQQRDGTSQSVKSGGGGRQHRATASRGINGTAAGGAGRASSHPASGTADYDDEIEEDEDDEDDTGALGHSRHDDPDQKADREKLGILIDALDRDQFDRYEMFRRVRLRKETVRKITNYVVSQSVPPSVVLTITGFAKTFIGLLIERARAVQAQEAKAGLGVAAEARRAERTNANGASGVLDPARLVFGPNGTDGVGKIDGEEGKDAQEDLGPLMPDHLREALRRYKRDGEGGGTGLNGVSVGLGVQGSAAAMLQGKRLFT